MSDFVRTLSNTAGNTSASEKAAGFSRNVGQRARILIARDATYQDIKGGNMRGRRGREPRRRA